MIALAFCFVNEQRGWSCASFSEEIEEVRRTSTREDLSDTDMNSLVTRLVDCHLDPTSRWTHHPCKGGTLFITDDAKIVTMRGGKTHQSYPLVDQDLNNFFSSLNHSLYFKGYGGKSNHLFISLRIAFAQKRTSLSWKKFFLGYDKRQDKYIFQEFPGSEKSFDQELSKLAKNFYFVNFRNGESQAEQEITFQDKNLKFMFNDPGDFVGKNATHSEPRAVHFLLNHLDLIQAALTVPDQHQIKFVQIGLHSFLDFCKECNGLVTNFQKNIRENLFKSLDDRHPLKRRLKEKPSHVLFLVSGQNNRLYNGKEYYFYDDNCQREIIHQRAGYFLKGYKPFRDVLPWDKKTFDENRLIISVKEPVIDPADQNDDSPPNVTCFVPLKTSSLYWGMAGKNLYEETEFFVKAINPNLFMVDLSNARLGIAEYDDYGDCCAASSGKEFQDILKALRVCKNLRHLDLSENWLSERSVVESKANLLCQTFSSFQNLTFLSLEHSLIHSVLSESFLTQVGAAIGTLSGLEDLNLSKNGFNADTFSCLYEGLCKLNNLRVLDLSGNRLAYGYDFDEDYKGSAESDTIDALSWIVNYVSGTSTMREVDLCDNDFDAIGFDWQEVIDEAGISDKNILRKVTIEDEISPIS